MTGICSVLLPLAFAHDINDFAGEKVCEVGVGRAKAFVAERVLNYDRRIALAQQFDGVCVAEAVGVHAL